MMSDKVLELFNNNYECSPEQQRNNNSTDVDHQNHYNHKSLIKSLEMIQKQNNLLTDQLSSMSLHHQSKIDTLIHENNKLKTNIQDKNHLNSNNYNSLEMIQKQNKALTDQLSAISLQYEKKVSDLVKENSILKADVYNHNISYEKIKKDLEQSNHDIDNLTKTIIELKKAPITSNNSTSNISEDVFVQQQQLEQETQSNKVTTIQSNKATTIQSNKVTTIQFSNHACNKQETALPHQSPHLVGDEQQEQCSSLVNTLVDEIVYAKDSNEGTLLVRNTNIKELQLEISRANENLQQQLHHHQQWIKEKASLDFKILLLENQKTDLEQTQRQMQSRIIELNNDLKKTIASKEVTNEQLVKITKENIDYQNSLHKKELDMMNITSNIDNLQRNIHNYEEQLVNERNQTNHIMNQLNEVNIEKQILEKQISEIKKNEIFNNNALTSQLTDKNIQISRYQAILSNKEAESADLIDQIKELQVQIVDNKKIANDVLLSEKKLRDHVEKQLEDECVKVTKLLQQISILNAQYDQSSSSWLQDKASLEKHIIQIEKAHQERKSNISDVTSELQNDRDNEISRYQAILSNKEAESTGLMDQIKVLQSQIISNNKIANETILESRIIQIEKAYQESKSKIAEMSEDMEKSIASNNAITSQLIVKNNEISNLQTLNMRQAEELSKLCDECISIKKLSDQVEKQLEDERDKVTALLQQISILKNMNS